MGRKRMYTIGDRVGRLTIVDWTCSKDDARNTISYAICKCDCGNTTKIFSGNFGRSIFSCGCLKKEMLSKKNKTHGESQTRLYGIWKAMRKRCNNPNDSYYHIYGKRGISVCEEWNENYEPFRDWSLQNGYENHLTIDRINVEKGYSPDNCRWATFEEQAKNKRRNVILEYKGEKLCLSDWGRRTGISATTIGWRVRHGWSVADALEKTPQQAV